MKSKFISFLALWGLFLVLSATVWLHTVTFTDVSKNALPLADLVFNSMDMEAADLDGDGDSDIIVAMEFYPNVLLLNNGNGRFTNVSAQQLPQKKHDSEDIALADFDLDGDIDIIFVSEDDYENEYYINDGKGSFTDHSHFLPVQGKSNAVIALDINDDNYPDLIIGNEGQNHVLINDRNGGWKDETTARYPEIADVTQDLEAGDVDGDGDADLLVANEDGNRLLLNDGEGRFISAAPDQLPVNAATEESREGDFGDVDNDGDLDIVFANVAFRPGKDARNRLLINDGKGFFTDETSGRLDVNKPAFTLDADFHDINDDGYTDLLFANGFGEAQQIYLNDGKGFFTESSSSLFGQPVLGDRVDVEVCDFNNDGKPDLYYSGFRTYDLLLTGNN